MVRQLVITTNPTRQGYDDHGYVLGFDLEDGDSVLISLIGSPEGDARPYDTREGVAVRVRPGAGAEMRVEAHMGERDGEALWADGWADVTFPATGNGQTEEAAGVVVNTAQACAIRVSSVGGPGDVAVRFGREPQAGYQG